MPSSRAMPAPVPLGDFVAQRPQLKYVSDETRRYARKVGRALLVKRLLAHPVGVEVTDERPGVSGPVVTLDLVGAAAAR